MINLKNLDRSDLINLVIFKSLIDNCDQRLVGGQFRSTIINEKFKFNINLIFKSFSLIAL